MDETTEMYLSSGALRLFEVETKSAVSVYVSKISRTRDTEHNEFSRLVLEPRKKFDFRGAQKNKIKSGKMVNEIL